MNDKQPILERLNYQASSATIHGMAGFAGTMLDAAQHIAIIEQSNTALQERVKELGMDKARLDWCEEHHVMLNCTMGAPGNYHYQVGSHLSEHSYRLAIDKRMEKFK